MSMAHHRAPESDIETDTATLTRPAPAASGGRGPTGMWALAWRQHRWSVIVSLAMIAIGITTLIVFRQYVLGRFAAAGCDPLDFMRECTGGLRDEWGHPVTADGIWWFGRIAQVWGFGEVLLIGGPILVGAFAGAALFPGEFAHRTHVFALTGSVSPRRWWLTKVAVAVGPVIAGFVALGFVSGWVAGTFQATAYGHMAARPLLMHGPTPAAVAAMAAALAIVVSLITRRTLIALAAALVASIVIAVLSASWLAPQLLPSQRTLWATGGTDQAVLFSPGEAPDALYVRQGYLDADENEVEIDMQRCWERASAADQAANAEFYATVTGDWDSEDMPDPDAYTRGMNACVADAGIAYMFQDYLPGSMLWPLRGVLAALLLAVAGLCLAACPAALRRAVAKR